MWREEIVEAFFSVWGEGGSRAYLGKKEVEIVQSVRNHKIIRKVLRNDDG